MYGGSLLYRVRLQVPDKLKGSVLDELHEGHVGVFKVKVLSRSYVWWLDIDLGN